ncbi:MAG: hypothetical protein NTW29_17000 [Bacteroidetes bacterium]|nr:hypothetical protein [Bacteroidota bacterium]
MYTSYIICFLFVVAVVFLQIIIAFCLNWKADQGNTFFDKLGNIVRRKSIGFLFKGLVDLTIIICFIFGIHSDIFSGYDKNKSNTKQNYNWLNTRDIVRFPVDQIKLRSSSNDIVTSLDLNDIHGLNFPEKINFVIINDKTASVDTSTEFETQASVLRKGFLDYLNKGRVAAKRINETEATKLNDIILLGLVKRVYELKKYNPHIEVNLSLNCYLGNDKMKSLRQISNLTNVDPKNDDQIIDEIDQDRDSLRSYQVSRLDTTDLVFVLNQINTVLNDHGYQKNNTIVVFISDFIHEKKITSFDYSVKQFRKNILSKIHQLCLIQYPYKKGRTDSDNKFKESVSYMVKKMFNDNFNNIYNYPLVTEQYMKDPVGYEMILNSLKFTNDIDNRFPDSTTYAYFYKPALFNTTLNATFCSIQIREKGTYNVVLRTSNPADNNTTFVRIDGENEFLFVDEPVMMTFDTDWQSKKMITYNFNSDCNYFLEVSRNDTQDYRQFRFPIVFREVLPKTSSQILLVSYMFWFLMAFFFCILFCKMMIDSFFEWSIGTKIYFFLFVSAKFFLLFNTLEVVWLNPETRPHVIGMLMLAAVAIIFFIKYLITGKK